MERGYSLDIKLQTDQVISRAEKAKEETIGGIVYTAYSYDDRILTDKVAEFLPPLGETAPTPAFRPLPFSHALERKGFSPAYDLAYKNGVWNVFVANRSYPVKPAEWFAGFFVERTSENVKLKNTSEKPN